MLYDLCGNHVHIGIHVSAIGDTVIREAAQDIGGVISHSVRAQGDIEKVRISEWTSSDAQIAQKSKAGNYGSPRVMMCHEEKMCVAT